MTTYGSTALGLSQARSSIHRVVLMAALLAGLALPCAAQEQVLTVGEHGSYPTIQGALSHVINGWTNELRVEVGTYLENVVISNATVPLTSGAISLSGGWDAAFSSQTADPSLTAIDGSSSGRCLELDLTVTGDTTIRLTYLTLTNGAAETGGGLYFNALHQVELDVRNSVFLNNSAGTASGGGYGGGLYATMTGVGNMLGVYDSSFEGNRAARPDGGADAKGGGAYVSVESGLGVVFRGVEFSANTVDASGVEYGGGLYILATVGSTAWVQDCRFLSNRATAITGGPTVNGLGLFLTLSENCSAGIRQVTLQDNLSQTETGAQLFVSAVSNGQVDVGDVLTAGGHTGADLRAEGGDEANLRLANVTSAGNTGAGLVLWLNGTTATMVMENSLLYGNGVDLSVPYGTPTASHNLVGVNPSFVDAAVGDYRLANGSVAEDAGTNTPAAGLGQVDCDGNMRLIGDVVDIGAFEGVDLIFSDGFEVYGTRHWSTTTGSSL